MWDFLFGEKVTKITRTKVIDKHKTYTREEVEDLFLEYRQFAWEKGLTTRVLTKWMREHL